MFQEIERLFEQARYSELSSLIAAASPDSLAALPELSLVKSAVASSISGHGEQAERLFLVVLDRDPTNADARLNLGVLRLQQQRYIESEALLSGYASEYPEDPNGLYNLAMVQFALGLYRECADRLSRFLQMSPDEPSARLYLARCAIELGDAAGAGRIASGLRIEMLDGLREFYELARLLSALDEGNAAERVYQHIAQQFPDELPARINLAQLYERANRIDEACALLDRIAESGASSHHFWLTRARLLAAGGGSVSALDALDRAEQTLPINIPTPERQSLLSEIHFERGQSLDKLNRYSEAYGAFERGNELARDRYREVVGHEEEGIEPSWYRDDSSLDSRVLQRYRLSAASDTPAFLVGFPRSGTTLLDQILDGHPGLQVMEEKPALENVALALESRFGSVAEYLRRAEDPVYTEMQTVYSNTVAHYLRRQPATRLVDKYPLSIARLQLGMAVFPGSQWIFAIRHPCDVVLSCFMQNFRFTNSTQGFWSLEQTAEIYVRTMSLWLDQRERLKPLCLDIRYEELVADFEGQARRLFEFLSLRWEPRVLDYREHALTRRIGTPSYRQVVQPIYKTARGRWIRYRQPMAPVLARLAPLAERLGYSVDPDA